MTKYTNWDTKTTFYFLVAFFALYGLNAYGFFEFSLLYQNPFELLPENQQWMHESSIQFFVGNLLFKFMDPKLAYIATQAVGIAYIISTYILLINEKEIDHSNAFLTLAFSPFFLIIFTWFGKPDIFLIGSFFGIVGSHGKYRLLLPLFLSISVFSHPEITLFYILFALLLKQIRLDLKLLLSSVAAAAVYGLYLNYLGEFKGRDDFIFENIGRLISTQLNQPLFSIFCTFGWLWLPIIYYRKELNIEFFIVFAISFGLTLLTIDHTRVFLLLSIPMLIYISHHFSLKDFVIKISPYFPIWIILFFQFQKTAGGAIIDESSRWTWLIDFLPFKSALANLMGI